MYSSYYSSNRNANNINNQIKIGKIAKKSTPEYLFLNLIKNFSILFLITTIVFIPIYVGLAQMNYINWKQTQKQLEFKNIILSGTIFSLKKYKTCVIIVKQAHNKIINNQKQTIQSKCFQNKMSSIPFIESFQEFHKLYKIYSLTLLFLLLFGVIFLEYQNVKLQIQLEYSLNQVNREKLLEKKNYHLKFSLNWPIYILKPKIKQQLQTFFNQRNQIIYSNQNEFKINNIKLLFNQKFKKYVQLVLKIDNLKSQNLMLQTIQMLKIATQNELKQQIQKKKTQIQALILERTQKQIQIHKQNQKYYTHHFWFQVNNFKSFYNIQNFLKNKNNKIKGFIAEGMSLKKVYIDKIQYSDIIIQNYNSVQNSISQFINLKKDSKDYFIHVNKRSKILLKFFHILKFICGIFICIFIVAFIDIIIMIINKTKIFDFSSVLVVLVLQILLKEIIIKFSIMEQHLLYSHQSLTTMIKLTLFLFFNLSFLLIIQNFNLGNWKWGKLISTYQYQEINQKWFIKVGSTMIITVIIQIIYCNLRVYIETIKGIFFGFLFRRLNSLIKFKQLKNKIQFYITDYKKNYKKPIIDLEICYSHIIPIYLLGIISSYLFPIMFLFLFIFSITLYHSQKNYIQLYSEKVPFSTSILDRCAFFMIYCSFLVSLVIFTVIEREYEIYILVCGIGIVVIWALKCILMSRTNLKIKRIKEISQIQNNQNNQQSQISSQTSFKQENTLAQNNEFTLTSEIIQNKLNKSSLNQQIKYKKIQKILLQLFHYNNQNINEVHSKYYEKYLNLINQQMKYLEKNYRKKQN